MIWGASEKHLHGFYLMKDFFVIHVKKVKFKLRGF